MDAFVIVVSHEAVDFGHKLTQRLEPRRIAEINLELRVERLLIAVFPRAAFRAPGNECAGRPGVPR